MGPCRRRARRSAGRETAPGKHKWVRLGFGRAKKHLPGPAPVAVNAEACRFASGALYSCTHMRRPLTLRERIGLPGGLLRRTACNREAPPKDSGRRQNEGGPSLACALRVFGGAGWASRNSEAALTAGHPRPGIGAERQLPSGAPTAHLLRGNCAVHGCGAECWAGR
jgi:hypothetical protein